jgi:hypothetical protein
LDLFYGFVQVEKKFGLIYWEHKIVAVIFDVNPNASFNGESREELVTQHLRGGGLLRDL